MAIYVASDGNISIGEGGIDRNRRKNKNKNKSSCKIFHCHNHTSLYSEGKAVAIDLSFSGGILFYKDFICMNTVWRFTGNPENWLTAIGIEKWAFNENKKGLWENEIQEGDVVLFHSTAKTDYRVKAPSAVIGFAYIGQPKYEKSDYWWIQEFNENKNKWPYVIPLSEIYLFSTKQNQIDFVTPIHLKSDSQIKAEIQLLLDSSLTISELNGQAKKISSAYPNFPVNSSASRVHEVYEQLIFDDNRDWFAARIGQDTDLLEKEIAESIDERIAAMDYSALMEKAKAFVIRDAPNQEYALRRVRRESQLQKRLVAKMEGYKCQLCGFFYEYIKENNKRGWIIEVDHIIEKSDGSSENLENLWVLCPNCHAKKTQGVVKIDPMTRTIREKGELKTLLHDQHLGWGS